MQRTCFFCTFHISQVRSLSRSGVPSASLPVSPSYVVSRSLIDECLCSSTRGTAAMKGDFFFLYIEPEVVFRRVRDALGDQFCPLGHLQKFYVVRTPQKNAGGKLAHKYAVQRMAIGRHHPGKASHEIPDVQPDNQVRPGTEHRLQSGLGAAVSVAVQQFRRCFT